MSATAWVVTETASSPSIVSSPTREEGRVTFDLDQVEVGSGIDHRFEQPRGVYLGVGEAHPMGAHVLRVAADVSDQEDSTLGPHAGRSY